jgi:hypothetical protein
MSAASWHPAAVVDERRSRMPTWPSLPSPSGDSHLEAATRLELLIGHEALDRPRR